MMPPALQTAWSARNEKSAKGVHTPALVEMSHVAAIWSHLHDLHDHLAWQRLVC